MFKLVHDWLRGEKNRQWLLVLDNADDAGVLSAEAGDNQELRADDGGGNNSNTGALRQHLSRYLPPSRHGCVLVTSRTKHAAMQLVEDSDIIPIEPMDDAAAHALLHTKLGNKGKKSDSDSNNNVAELAAALDHMPLALVQAAAYIRQRAPRCSVQQYLEEYQQSDEPAEPRRWPSPPRQGSQQRNSDNVADLIRLRADQQTVGGRPAVTDELL
jgi:hypothetical protein